MAGRGSALELTHCPYSRRISMADEHGRCVLCLGAAHDPQGCGACAAMAPYATRLRWERLPALMQARSGGGTDLHPERVSCGAAKGKSTKRRHELAFPTSTAAGSPVVPSSRAQALLKDPLLSPPKTESAPQSKTFAVPDNTHSLQKKHCCVRTKQPKSFKSANAEGITFKQFCVLASAPSPALCVRSRTTVRGISMAGYAARPARAIPLIAEAASRPKEPPPELATDPLVSSSAGRMLLEPGMSSVSQELVVSLEEAVTSS